ncbi:hypothetical protein AVEN_267674-1 [Araneus ventricosus]|uniref:Uncharacterized protein n=1 Tax=Araneus ventricosus TaxID=182803 RepID=A0A4Y2TYT9_ARAVE|nr:hypothetical protein AVEN_267674-1 [Araneus ventricosus]
MRKKKMGRALPCDYLDELSRPEANIQESSDYSIGVFVPPFLPDGRGLVIRSRLRGFGFQIRDPILQKIRRVWGAVVC